MENQPLEMDGMIRSLQGEPEKLTPEVAVFSGCNVTNGKARDPPRFRWKTRFFQPNGVM